MFSAATLESHIRPRGLTMKVTEIQPEALQTKVVGITSYSQDRKFYKAKVEGYLRDETHAQCEVEFSLPIPDAHGVFEISGARRYIAQEGIVDLAAFQLGQPLEFLFRPRTRVFLMALTEIFSGMFYEFFMRGQPPNSTEIQTAIDAWIRSSPMTQEVPDSGIGLESLKELVYLRVGGDSLDTTERRFSERLWGRIDPASTPQGGKVNLAYRRAHGSEMQGSILKPGRSLFCTSTQMYGIAACLSPRRAHLIRSGIEHAMPLVAYENPLVGNAGIPGRHLRTAIMNLRAHAGEDAIVLSASAAEKMKAVRLYKEQVYGLGEIHMKVKEGDPVVPGQVLAEVTDPLEGVKAEVHARKSKYPCFVDKIRAVKTALSGIPAVRIDVHLRAEIPVETGDKLYTRAGQKGVARIVRDENMPVMPDGRIIEAIISPESVVGRRAMLVYWEMMANEYVRKTKEPVNADHVRPSPSFEEFVTLGYGDGVKLTYMGEELPEETFVGLTFFMRIDKLAREMLSCHDDKVTLNGLRLPVDSARVSGQKRDLAKALAMLGRGLQRNFTYSLIMNMFSQHAYTELTKVLGVQYEKKEVQVPPETPPAEQPAPVAEPEVSIT